MNILSRPVLVLTSGFQPYDVITSAEAFQKLFLEKAWPVLEDNNIRIHSMTDSWALPKAISMKNYSILPVKNVFYSKLNVVYRDELQCQYCGMRFKSVEKLTIDHIIPLSRWEKINKKNSLPYEVNSFENCVACCFDCNQKKGCLTADEFRKRYGIKLLRKPFQPKFVPHLYLRNFVVKREGWKDLVIGQPSVKLIA